MSGDYEDTVGDPYEWGEPSPKPCSDCPWLRTSLRGWLGPGTTADWITAAHADGPIGCHKTMESADVQTKHCTGAAIYRANVFKSTRTKWHRDVEQDTQQVFARSTEFQLHHGVKLPW